MRIALFVLLIIGAAGWPQQPKNKRPDFKNFAVKWLYLGAPVPPKIDRGWRTFRTMIRYGAKSPVQFAGHYTVPRWGCGARCNAFVIVDSITGKVYDGFLVSDLPDAWTEKHEELERMEFHPESRLMKINA